MHPDQTLNKYPAIWAHGVCFLKATFSDDAVKLFEKRDLMRQRGSPGGICQIKVNCVSEIAPVRSAVNSWILHVQVERFADRRRKSAQKHRDTKQRAAEEGCCPRRLYAHSSRTHCLRLGLVHQSLFFFFNGALVPSRGAFRFADKSLKPAVDCG